MCLNYGSCICKLGILLLVVIYYMVFDSLSIQNCLSSGEGLAVNDNQSLLNVKSIESSGEVNRIHICHES